MAIDELVATRDILERYEDSKKNILLNFLNNIRKLKAAENENEIKKEISAMREMLPRLDGHIEVEMEKFAGFNNVTSRLMQQKHLLNELKIFSQSYFSTEDKISLNVILGNIIEVIKQFIGNCDHTKHEKIKFETGKMVDYKMAA